MDRQVLGNITRETARATQRRHKNGNHSMIFHPIEDQVLIFKKSETHLNYTCMWIFAFDFIESYSTGKTTLFETSSEPSSATKQF